jgi:hypothetical protein
MLTIFIDLILKSSILKESQQILVSGRSQRPPVEDSMPLYTPGQNSRNEKYIPTSITDWNLAFQGIMSTDDFRKKSLPGLTVPPY